MSSEREMIPMSSEREMIPKVTVTAQATESVNQRDKSDGLSLSRNQQG